MASILEEFEKQFSDLAEVHPEPEAKADDNEWATYCRKCEMIVDFKKRGRKKVCSKCYSKLLSLGTKRALRNVYKLDEDDKRKKFVK